MICIFTSYCNIIRIRSANACNAYEKNSQYQYEHAFFEPHTASVLTGKGVWELVYLVVFSTTLGMSLQNIGESMTRASHAAMILSLESVFGVVFSAIFLREKITSWMLAGFTLILAAIMISVRKTGAEDRPESPELM